MVGFSTNFGSSLLPSTVEALVCSQDWIQVNVLPPDEDDKENDDAFTVPSHMDESKTNRAKPMFFQGIRALSDLPTQLVLI